MGMKEDDTPLVHFPYLLISVQGHWLLEQHVQCKKTGKHSTPLNIVSMGN